MLLPKDVIRQFRTGAWVGQAELDTFLADAGKLESADLLRLLDTLTDRALWADAQSHRARCIVFAGLVSRNPDRELFVPFSRALKKGDANLRAILAPLLVKSNNVAGHAELASMMNAPDPALRKTVAQVFKQITSRAAFDELASIVQKGDGPGVLESLELLVTIAGHVAVPVLASLLSSTKSSLRAQSARFLGDRQRMQKDLPGAARALASVLADPDERLVMEAVTALGQITDEDQYFELVGPAMKSPNTNVVRATVIGLRNFSSDRVVRTLTEKFHEGPNIIRGAVLDTCEAMASEAVVPALVEALSSKHLNIRQRAGEVLTSFAKLGKVDLARTVLWLVRSRDVNVRRIAIDMARAVGDPQGQLWPKLLKFLRDEDWWVRERATDALLDMAGKELTKHLIGMLQDPSDVIRRYAADVLGRTKDASSLGPLVRTAVNDADWWVRERAIASLAAIGDLRALPYLVDLLTKEPPLRVALLAAIETMKGREATPQVIALLDEQDNDLRLAAIKCLGVIGDPSCAQPLIRLCVDTTDPPVREAARELLTRWNCMPQTEGQTQAGERAMSLLDRLLVAISQRDGDDLILQAGRRPCMRKLAQTTPLANNLFSDEQLHSMLWQLLSPAMQQDLQVLKDADFSYEVKAQGIRFRANVFRQATGIAAVFRKIGSQVLSLESLGVPPIVSKLGDLKNGLVLVGGPTGAGKSTTLAALIDYINMTSSRHIVTLEDPIEAIHLRKSSLVNQREIGSHTRSFHAALRSAMRQDPDVLLVGEMRDLETIRFAVTAAETGHLVFATIHTVAADTSIDRIVDVFPPAEQPQVRSILADSLRAVVCQYLLSRKDAKGRILACEVLLNNDAVANLIRKGKTFQIPAVIATSKDDGMQTMDWDLERLAREGRISLEDAYAKGRDKRAFETLLSGEIPGKAAAPGGHAAVEPLAAVRSASS